MNDLQVVIYARVSSEQQSEAKTIESQLSELRAHVKGQGLPLPREHEFIDDGESWSDPHSSSIRTTARCGCGRWH